MAAIEAIVPAQATAGASQEPSQSSSGSLAEAAKEASPGCPSPSVSQAAEPDAEAGMANHTGPSDEAVTGVEPGGGELGREKQRDRKENRKTRKARKAEVKGKRRDARAEARLAAEKAMRDLDEQPHEELLAAMEAACAAKWKTWQAGKSWDPETAGLLDEALQAMAKAFSPTPADTEARLAVVDRVNSAIQAAIPSQQGIYVEAYGSFVSGSYNASSDLDMSLEGEWVADPEAPDFPPSPQMGDWSKPTRAKMLRKVCKILKKAKVSRGYVEIIAHARIPLIKFVDSVTGISCDLCVGNAGAAFKSHVMGFMNNIDWRFAPLTMLVKRWAKEHSLNNPSMGSFNSFALSLMVAFYMQTCKPPALPPICDLFAGTRGALQGRPLEFGPYNPMASPESLEVARSRALQFKERAFGEKQTASLATMFSDFIALLVGAINWWATEGTGIVRISAWAGCWTTHPWASLFTVAVEDPFDASENCARSLSTRDSKSGLKVVKHAISAMEWTTGALQTIQPSTGLADLVDELFGSGTVDGLPHTLQKKLKRGTAFPGKPVLQLPAEPGLRPGDINFRDTDQWKNWTPRAERRQGRRPARGAEVVGAAGTGAEAGANAMAPSASEEHKQLAPPPPAALKQERGREGRREGGRKAARQNQQQQEPGGGSTRCHTAEERSAELAGLDVSLRGLHSGGGIPSISSPQLPSPVSMGGGLAAARPMSPQPPGFEQRPRSTLPASPGFDGAQQRPKRSGRQRRRGGRGERSGQAEADGGPRGPPSAGANGLIGPPDGVGQGSPASGPSDRPGGSERAGERARGGRGRPHGRRSRPRATADTAQQPVPAPQHAAPAAV
mmetsp:Transcript_30086/g.84925  ORF Transcript_30086/g.84925 Transcript_30086/m.84925 type:complete len:843 (-) Transcript_30086:45-2573(-)